MIVVQEKILQENPFALFQPQGHLDSQNGIKLKQQFESMTPEQYSLWVVDLAQVDFMDSAGLMALVTGLQTAARNNCRLVLSNLHPAVKLIFEITQLDQAFDIVDCSTTLLAKPVKAAEQGFARDIAAKIAA